MLKTRALRCFFVKVAALSTDRSSVDCGPAQKNARSLNNLIHSHRLVYAKFEDLHG